MAPPGPNWVAVAGNRFALGKGQTAAVGEDERAQILTRDALPAEGPTEPAGRLRGPRGSGRAARLGLLSHPGVAQPVVLGLLGPGAEFGEVTGGKSCQGKRDTARDRGGGE